MDPLLNALSATDFQWTARIGSIWQNSSSDIPELQHVAREQVGTRLSALRKFAQAGESPLGIPIIGQGGAGKTHLLSAIRRDSLAQGHFFVLADMTDIREFWETILSGYITSLDQKVDGVAQVTRLLEGLVQQAEDAPSVDELVSGRPPRLINCCNALIKGIGGRYRAEVREHQDVIRALVLLASNDFDIQDRGSQWLQGLSISDDEAFRHGFMQTQKRPGQIVRGLSWLMSLVAPTVLGLDQLDAIVAEHNLAGGSEQEGEPTARQQASLAIIQNLAGGLLALRDLTSRTLTVLSCLEATWGILVRRAQVTMLDRFEAPLLLQPIHDARSIRGLIELRLGREYAAVDKKPAYPAYPFGEAFFTQRIGALPREVLKACREHQLACMAAGRVFEIGASGKISEPPPPDIHVQEQFEKLLARMDVSPLLERQDEEALDKLLEVACDALVEENQLPDHMDALVDKDFAGTGSFEPLHARLRVVDRSANDRELHYAFRFLEKAHHVSFQSRLKAAMTSAGIDRELQFRRLAILRVAPAPSGALSEKLLDELEQRGGRLVEPELDELRVLAALKEMLDQGGPTEAKTLSWLRSAKPVSRLNLFKDAIEFLFNPAVAPAAQHAVVAPATPIKSSEGPPLPPNKGSTAPSKPEPTRARPAPPAPPVDRVPVDRAAPVGTIHIGSTRALAPKPVDLDAEQLKRHVAVLGGSGSGKTTLALSILEQLLRDGIPVLLVDRKGDLCRYGDPDLRKRLPKDDPLARLLSVADVAVFTPGQARGRPLAIPLLPTGLEHLDASERHEAYRDASAALGAMLRLKDTAPDQTKQAIIMQGLRVLGESQAAANIGVGSLIELIASEDPTLLEALGHLDPKHCKKLAEHLQTMVHMRGEVLADAEDKLSAELLFGMGEHKKPQKTRLSIVSTKFLGDEGAILFWVSQLVLELNRFASRTPSPRLQAAVMFDEADIYLPATSKPPTKPPLESLLKRARSAGLSVMLATQSPGDLDYKCRENVRNWFVGLVKETRALEKLKPLLSDAKLDASAVLPKQKVGQFFMLSETGALPLTADRNLLETEQLSEPEILRIASESL